MTNPAGQLTRYSYNADNQPTKVSYPTGTSALSSYDAAGNLISATNPGGERTKYGYDALNRRTSSTDPLGRTTRYSYDAAGNRVTMTDPSGRVTTFGYDAANELTSITYSDGSTPDVYFSYDPDGQRSTMTDGTGETTYGYDADQRLTSVTNGAGATVSYSYDPAGRLTSLTYPNGDAVTRTYNRAGELTEVKDWLNDSTSFGYDASGNLTAVTYPNGVKGAFGYDAAGQLTSIADKKAAATLVTFSYVRNKLGLVTTVHQGGAFTGVEDYSYTQLSQLAADSAGKYSYDKAGDLTKRPGGVTQVYNADGELTSVSQPKHAKVSYAYDKQGNRTSATTAGHPTVTLGYDQANRLVSYGTTASFGYNGDGQRMSETVNGATVAFTWDESAQPPLVLVAGSTYYIYGPNDQPIEQLSGTTATYLLCDQQGSIRVLTSSTGMVVGTYSYGSFGNLISHTGAVQTALRYDGQYTDTGTAYLYLGARYYDPASGEFLTTDPLVAQTGSAYGYAGSDPVNEMDITGLCWGPTCWISAQFQTVQDSVSQAWNAATALATQYARMPDYVTVDFSGGDIGVGGVVLTVTRDGSVYLAPQAGLGTPGASLGIRGGWLDQLSTPCASQVDSFVAGWSGTLSANIPIRNGVGVSVGETWGNEGHFDSSDFSTEAGLGIGGGVNLTESYSFKLPINVGGW